ncbi:MAG: hypothetical protein ACSLEL_02945 [Candidatus Malihini olakiniferum]
MNFVQALATKVGVIFCQLLFYPAARNKIKREKRSIALTFIDWLNLLDLVYSADLRKFFRNILPRLELNIGLYFLLIFQLGMKIVSNAETGLLFTFFGGGAVLAFYDGFFVPVLDSLRWLLLRSAI